MYCDGEETKNKMELDDTIDKNQLLLAYQEVIEPIEDIVKITPNKIWEIFTELKQGDGEHWAVGEMLERAFIFLTALEIDS